MALGANAPEETTPANDLAAEMDSPQEPEQELESGATGNEESTPVVEETPSAEGTTGPTEQTPPAPPFNTEMEDLRGIIRTQARQMALMQSRLAQLSSAPQRKSEAGEDELEDGDFAMPKAMPTALEVAQAEVNKLAASRADFVELSMMQMESQAATADVRSVCTPANLGYIIDAAATDVARKEGRDVNEVALEMEKTIWKLPNPVKWIYNTVKQYHPLFTQKTVAEEPTTKKQSPQVAQKKNPLGANAPSSIQDMGGSNAVVNTGWTAARIDSMDIDELHTVPPKIYEQYLAGDLK